LKSRNPEYQLPNHVLVGRYIKHFYDIPTPCPYGMSDMALYRQAQFGFVDDPLMNAFLGSGFRRNGNTIYTMGCPECDACRSLRINPLLFKPNRSQRRVLKKCAPVTAVVNELEVTKEKLDLLNSFFSCRFPHQENDAVSYYGTFFANGITDTYEIEYTLDDELLGVSIIDVGTLWLNAVYFYFDNRFKHLSPGIFNILFLIDLCRRQEIRYLYLGYSIADHTPMAYKTSFKPHEIYHDNVWHPSAPHLAKK
jgi:arginine-tRNA-protein transferase